MVPVPRSFQQILSDMLDSFLSRVGLKRIKIGSPILSILEAAAQSDLRSTQDIFNLLDAQSLDRADGDALDRIAADENLQRIPTTPATGYVTFIDSTFEKIQTSIYQGLPAPNVGATAINVVDAASLPSTGQIYIGRGTVNFEGPLSYTSITDNTSYWTINLSSGTTKFHNLGESVILAQGGTRQIPAGTVVQTPQGNAINAVKFSTLYNAQIDDGENTVSQVEVIATVPGVTGNVPSGAIREIPSPPFTGATVTNPLPYTNGLPAEGDQSLKERIKNARQARTKGTKLAITSGVIGVTSTEDNKTVLSASLVAPQGETATLFIDDGTGYEEVPAGIATETLMDSALGGEQIFQLLAPRPVMKAFVTSTLTSPFILTAGAKLAVKVGGVLSEHTFVSSSFKNITNATAYEVVSSINGDPNLTFSARLSNLSTTVTIFAKTDTNEYIEVVTPADGINANDALGFPSGINYTLRLYKNDVFLHKDGSTATINSNSQSEWSNSITDGETLSVQVDFTDAQTITITNLDFINNNTGFSTVSSSNSLESWATVLNAKIAGITATAGAGVLTLQSNLNSNDRSQVKITGGSLITKGMFNLDEESVGASSDYTLDRNTGQLKLTTPLEEGDSLIVSTPYTRAYVESQELTNNLTFSSDANLWFCVDGSPTPLNTNLSSITPLTITNPTGNVARYTGATGLFGESGTTAWAPATVYTAGQQRSNGAYLYECVTGGTSAGSGGPVGTGSNIIDNNVVWKWIRTLAYIQPGDWVVIWDPEFTDKGMFRVSNIAGAPNYQYFDIENICTPETATPTNLGIVFVRTNESLQNIVIPSGTYSVSALVDSLNETLIGAAASIFRGNYVRVTTNNFEDGNILLVTADLEGQKIGLPTASVVENNPSHFASIQTSNSEVGTPTFKWDTIASVSSGNFQVSNPDQMSLTPGQMLVFAKRLNGVVPHFGSDTFGHFPIFDIVGDLIYPRENSKTTNWLPGDRWYGADPFTVSPNDTLNVTLDNDFLSKNFNFNLFRNVVPGPGATYGVTAFEFLDADNGNASLQDAFGNSTSFFNDFALYMHARGKSNSIDSNSTILWRNARFGPEGNNSLISYTYPEDGNTDFGIETNTLNGNANIQITLPMGTERTGLNISGENPFVIAANTTYIASIGNVDRLTNVVTVTLAASGTSYAHALSTGDVIYQIQDQNSGNVFRKGPKVITGTTATTFSYAENGADGDNTLPLSYVVSKLPAGTSYSVSSLVSNGTTIKAYCTDPVFSIGDTIYFTPGHFDATSGVEITAGAKVLVDVTSTYVEWNEVTAVGTANLIGGVNYYVSAGRAEKTTVLYTKTQVAVGALARVGSVVTATMTQTSLVSTHPFSIGDIVYLSPGEANFPAGAKIITGTTGTTFTYTETGAAVASLNIQYFSTTTSDPNFTGGGTPVLVGDVAVIGQGTLLDSQIKGVHKVLGISSTTFSFLNVGSSYTGDSVPQKLGAPSFLRFFPIDTANATAGDLVTWINANASDYVTAVLVPDNSGSSNNGSGILDSSLEDYLRTTNNASLNGSADISLSAWPLFDGINWIQSTTLSVSDSDLSLKSSVNGELVNYADFENEEMRLVPTTAQNFVDFLNSTAVSALPANAVIESTLDGAGVQITSNTIGSVGAVKISGGNGNSTTASVIGSGILDISTTPNSGSVVVAANQTSGFSGDMSVMVQGSIAAPKIIGIDENTTIELSSVSATEWLVQFTNTTSSLVDVLDTVLYETYQIEQQGQYVAYINTTGAPLPASLKAGDWVYINGIEFSQVNTGFFQVVAFDEDNNTFWIENSNCIPEVITMVQDDTFVQFLTYDSVIPGDILSINTNILGSENQGNFTVSSLSISGSNVIAADEFIISGELTAAGPETLGSDYIFIQVIEGSPIKLLRKIKSIVVNSDNTSQSFITFTNPDYITKMSSTFGTVLTAQNKLNFPIDTVVGLDGYSHGTGLLAEVNKVVYGDETNPSVYPGLIAAGANIDISGPLIKRITCSLALRLRSGVSATDIVDRVKSAVAAMINQTPIGQAIAISDIVSVANSIDGVLAVTILSPVYTSGSDLIAVSESEKPLVLDISSDILVSIIS